RELDDRYPDRPEILKYLAYTYRELGHFPLYQFNLERWVEVAPEDPGSFLALGAAYLERDRPALALETFKLIREKFPESKDKKEVEETIAELEKAMAEIARGLLDMEVSDRTQQILLLHEKAMSALAMNNFAETREYTEQLLEIEPNFAAALNNMSFAYWFENQPEKAIAVTEQCLTANPNSYHAISNYIAYRAWQDRQDGLEEYAEKLKTPSDRWQKDPDYWVKAAEAFSWLEDDESLLELYKTAEQSECLEAIPGIFYHYLAAAHLRQKQEKEARTFWEKALEKQPNLSTARENLEDMKQPAGTHHSPWSFAGDRWLVGKMRMEILEAIDATDGEDEQLQEVSQNCLEKYPALNSLIPQMIKRGDPGTRTLAMLLAKYAKTPELLEVLREFALSDIGPDNMRHEAAYTVSQAGLMPAGKTRMWIKGKWQDILLIGIEIHDDVLYDRADAAKELLGEGTQALREENARKAEEVFKKALELEPEAPDFSFNLAIAYQLQDREEEMEALCQEIYDRDPNYPFARIALAKRHLDRKEFEKANELIQPMIQWKSMNYQAFNYLCQTHIELALAQKQPEGAQTWLQMWQQVIPEHPNQEYWQSRIEHPGGIIDDL
ncbi:MAG: tetratricopeptide repeat protein, partial [Spirulina sp.]